MAVPRETNGFPPPRSLFVLFETSSLMPHAAHLVVSANDAIEPSRIAHAVHADFPAKPRPPLPNQTKRFTTRETGPARRNCEALFE